MIKAQSAVTAAANRMIVLPLMATLLAVKA